MKAKKILAFLLIFAIASCFFGCGRKEFDPSDVKCVLGEAPEEIKIQSAELDDENQNIIAIIDENNKMVFHCDGVREYDGYKIYPEWLRLYKLEVIINNTSGYDLRSVKPYLDRQWDVLIFNDFETPTGDIKAHSGEITATVYAITDYDISVMRSAFVDNRLELLYTAYDGDKSIGEFGTKFSYK